MWDRLLFTIRSRLPNPVQLLGSWKLSVVLMVLAALYYALLAIWATSSPPHVVQNIAGLAPFLIVYGLLMVNTGVCLWRRIPLLRRDLGRWPILVRSEPRWQHIVGADWTRESAHDLVRALGYSAVDDPEYGVCGVAKRGRVLAVFVFHLAFFLVALGFGLSALGRREASVWVAEGESFGTAQNSSLSRSGVVPSDFSEVSVDSISPEFWRDQLLFTRLESRLRFPGGTEKVTSINRPLWLGWGTFLRMTGFGYAPRYEVLARDGQVVDSAWVKLNVFPPGQRDHFRSEVLPHRVYVMIYPDFKTVDGTPTTRTLNLVNPAFFVSVVRGKVSLGEAILENGQIFEFEGLSLRFPEIRYWGEFSFVADPGAPPLFAGFLLGLTGLVLALRGRRAEVRWTPGSEDRPGLLEGWGSAGPVDRDTEEGT
jgi:hypothetical protein